MTRRDHALLVADGFVLTLGTVTAGFALSYGLFALQHVVGDVVLGLGSGLLVSGSGVAGVVLAWLLHGRRITVAATIGGLLGSVAVGLTIPLAAGLSALLGLPLKLVTDFEFAGPLALLTLISAAVVALIVWLLADSANDVVSGRRLHVRLDVARIAASVMFVALAVVSVYLVFTQPGPEQGEAPIFAIAEGLVAAGAVAGADLANVVTHRRAHSEMVDASV